MLIFNGALSFFCARLVRWTRKKFFGIKIAIKREASFVRCGIVVGGVVRLRMIPHYEIVSVGAPAARLALRKNILIRHTFL
jgi:hypothetical protein